MTATAMTDREPGPGERAMLARQLKQRRVNSVIVAAVVAVILLLPFALGFADGVSGAPQHPPAWLPSVSAGLVVLIAIVGGLIQWRQHDEVIRRRAINAYATIGLISLFGHPLIGALAPLGITIKPDLVWAVAIVGGIATYLYQRFGG